MTLLSGLLLVGMVIGSPLGRSSSYAIVIGYGRHSSSRQNDRSADDQNANNKKWAKTLTEDDVPFKAFVDKGIPGSIADRDGLTAVLEETHRHPNGVLVVESISRLGRSISLVMKILDDLTDRGWRFVARNDMIDTDSPFWPIIAAVIAACAEMENAQKAMMVTRGRQAQFRRGNSVGNFPKCHYVSVPTDPTNPVGDRIVEKREELAAGIREFFERIASGQTIAEANAWANARSDLLGRDTPWELDDGARMIRSPRYMGVIREGRTRRELIRTSGVRVAVKNDDPDDVEEMFDERQQFVDAELWQQANDVLDERNPPRTIQNRYPREKKNRRTGLWPSGAVHCAACGAKMHRKLGQTGTRYACPNARGASRTCWNHLSAETADIRSVLIPAVAEKLLALDHAVPVLLEQMRQAAAGDDGDARMARDQQKLAEAKKRLSRLYSLAEEHDVDDELRQRIAGHQREVRELERRVAHHAAAETKRPELTEAQLRERIAQVRERLEQTDDKELLGWMWTLVPHFVLQPVSIRGCRTLLLQARFTLELVNLLPTQWRALLSERPDKQAVGELVDLVTHEMALLVTSLPKYVELAPAIVRDHAEGQGMGKTELVRKYGVDYGVINRALKLMAEQPNGAIEAVPLSQLPDQRAGKER